MILNEELQAIQKGEKGEGLQKVLNTLIMYGEAFDAKRMVKITGGMGHVVFGSAPVTWIPVFDLLDELLEYGLTSTVPYTADPLSFDPELPMSLPQKVVSRYIYGSQDRLDKQYDKLGFAKETKGYTCTCYMPEVGNIPKKGDILSWAESSAVSYANSVIGARTNRNSGIIDHMGQILGYVPEFGLLTDEGRRADWIIEIRTEKKPESQILGSAIGMKVVDQVPYIKGLDQWIGTELDQAAKDYLKDMGAAAASNGAVGLYHVDRLTPEAVEQGESLINEGARVYVIDDAELERVKQSYPCVWKDPDAEPQIAFIGCPHLSIDQMVDWTERLASGLKRHGEKTVTVPTVMSAAPPVIDAFREQFPELAKQLKEMKIILSSTCPLGYSSNPLSGRTRMITASNKFRYYSSAKFYSEEELIDIITGGRAAA